MFGYHLIGLGEDVLLSVLLLLDRLIINLYIPIYSQKQPKRFICADMLLTLAVAFTQPVCAPVLYTAYRNFTFGNEIMIQENTAGAWKEGKVLSRIGNTSLQQP